MHCTYLFIFSPNHCYWLSKKSPGSYTKRKISLIVTALVVHVDTCTFRLNFDHDSVRELEKKQSPLECPVDALTKQQKAMNLSHQKDSLWLHCTFIFKKMNSVFEFIFLLSFELFYPYIFLSLLMHIIRFLGHYFLLPRVELLFAVQFNSPLWCWVPISLIMPETNIRKQKSLHKVGQFPKLTDLWRGK